MHRSWYASKPCGSLQSTTGRPTSTGCPATMMELPGDADGSAARAIDATVSSTAGNTAAKQLRMSIDGRHLIARNPRTGSEPPRWCAASRARRLPARCPAPRAGSAFDRRWAGTYDDSIAAVFDKLKGIFGGPEEAAST